MTATNPTLRRNQGTVTLQLPDPPDTGEYAGMLATLPTIHQIRRTGTKPS